MSDSQTLTSTARMAARVDQSRPADIRHRSAGSPDEAESAILIVVATVGIVGNCAIILAVLIVPRLRQPRNAFVLHQCLLDLLKSTYCLPFAGQSLAEVSSLCGLVGGSYIVLVTSSGFNLLAMVMNESYQLNDLMINVAESRNCCCVVFGIFAIWFGSVVMNLGVAFIPGNPSYDGQIGLCLFIYGITRNYVLHLLWILLVTMALCCTAAYLCKLHRDIRRMSYYRLTTLVRATVTIDPKATSRRLRERSERQQKRHVKYVQHVTTKKLFLLVLLTAMFVLFWYPLFVLTLIDPRVAVSHAVYKALSVFAFSNPTITPIVLFFFVNATCCSPEDGQHSQQQQQQQQQRRQQQQTACGDDGRLDAELESDTLMRCDSSDLWMDHVTESRRGSTKTGGATKQKKKNVTWQSPSPISSN